MTVLLRKLYRSPNGDHWHLARDADTGRVFIRHVPNVPSGGRVSDFEIAAFLQPGGHGPEHQELLRLIGTLADQAPLKDPARPDVSIAGGEAVRLVGESPNVALRLRPAVLVCRLEPG